jgi:hypothetical protein
MTPLLLLAALAGASPPGDDGLRVDLSVDWSSVRAMGPRPVADLVMEVRQKEAELEACADPLRSEGLGVERSVSVRFTASDGRTTEIVGLSPKAPDLVPCITDVVGEFEFVGVVTCGPTTFDIPLRFFVTTRDAPERRDRSDEFVGIGALTGYPSCAGPGGGLGGLGSRGSGLGGGGTAEARRRASGAEVPEQALRTPTGSSVSRARPVSVAADPIILGALDRVLIDEVIKRHMNQIRYCYRRELRGDATLAGKVVIRFTIAGDGTVSRASTKETTMNNSAVEGCIVGRFQRMQFAEPRGGGVVIVSYPFLFSPG